MFKNLFWFEGRIGRKEFTQPLVTFIIVMILLQAVSSILIGTKALDETVV